MTKARKIVLGIATVWPLIYLIFFIAFILFAVFFITEPSLSLKPKLFLLLKIHVITIIWSLALLAFYAFHLKGNIGFSKQQKIVWAIAFFLAGMISLPIYWFLYIWRQDSSTLLSSENV